MSPGHLRLTLPSFHFSEAKNQNATIRSRFPQERIAPITRPVSVGFQIQESPTSSPSVGPVGGFNPSPSTKFPKTFDALTKLSLSDSEVLLKEYGLEDAISDKTIPEEARLDNLNKLISLFGVSFPLPTFRRVLLLFVFSYLFWMLRSVIGYILGQRRKGQSSQVYGTADKYLST